MEPKDNSGIIPSEEGISRDDLISSILTQNRSKFDQWLKSADPIKPLDIPRDVWDAFVPRRVYELSDDPRGIRANFYANLQPYTEQGKKQELEFFIERPAPISELRPTGRDILVELNLAHHNSFPKTLVVENIFVINDLRSNGIGTDFYNHIIELAKALGFRFIVGSNDKTNIDFFVKKLERTPLNEIPPSLRKRIFSTRNFEYPDAKAEFSTVQFLYPEDKEVFLETS